MSPELLIDLPTRRATIHLARKLSPLLASGDLVILEGDLGAGKTFFARALCRALGVPREERVQSPTFAIVHEHQGAALRIAHADLYRLRDPGELGPIGLRDARAEGALLIVEWGGAHADALGGDALMVRLALGPPRGARVGASGPTAAARLRDLEATWTDPRRPARPPRAPW